MSYKACPSYLFHSYCPYGSSCPFMHVALPKTCLNFSQTNYCKYFPNCKYLHFDYSLSYVPQPKDSFYNQKEQHLKKQLQQNIHLIQTTSSELVYNITLNKDYSSLFFFEESLRKYLQELSAKSLQDAGQIKTLTINFNPNFIEKFSIIFSLLQAYLQKTETLKISLTNVYINDAFLIELIGLLNKISDLNILHLSFQNCILQKETDKQELLRFFSEKIKNIREFRFMINYDYSMPNNDDYQMILGNILMKLLQGNNIRKMELFLGLSNFEFLQSLNNIKNDDQSLIFQKLDFFSISLSNLPDRNQMTALGIFLSLIPKVKSLSINFFNHDKKQLTNDKINEKLVFDFKMAESLENLSLLRDLQYFSVVFEEKIFKEAHAFDLMLSYLTQINTLNGLELEGSHMLSELNSQNLLKIINNNQESLRKFSLKLSYNQLDKSFVQKFFTRIQNLKNMSHLALDFEFSKLNNNSINKLAFSLESLTILKSLSLNLSKNRISEEGCRFLGNSLNKLTSLEILILDLSFNTILDFGLKELVAQMPRNIHDLMILIERNGISCEGIKAIKPLLEEKFCNLRKIYFDFLSNESIGKEGNFLIMDMFERICRNNIVMIEGNWESDYLESGGVDERLRKRRDGLKEFLNKKRILAYQMKKMKEKFRKCFRRDLRIGIAVEKLFKKSNI